MGSAVAGFLIDDHNGGVIPADQCHGFGPVPSFGRCLVRDCHVALSLEIQRGRVDADVQ